MTIMQPISSEHTHRPISYKELAMLDVMFRRRIITQRVPRYPTS